MPPSRPASSETANVPGCASGQAGAALIGRSGVSAAAAPGSMGSEVGEQPHSSQTPSGQPHVLGEEVPTPRGRRFLLFQAVPSWVVSMVIHVMILVTLGLVTLGPQPDPFAGQLVALANDGPEEIEEFKLHDIEPLDVTTFQSSPAQPMDMEVIEEMPELSEALDLESAAMAIELQEFSDEIAPRNELLAEVGALTGAAFEGRGSTMRTIMVEKYGGTAGSERAVANALQWLVRHQLPDGGWSFNHTLGECQGRCSHAGELADSRAGATAMALLPFLGAGQTHLEGQYKRNVEAGLLFLIKNMKVSNGMGSFWEPGGQMYTHGLCAIVLTEAYGMTQDQALLSPAQLSLNYIVYAQDPVGGGWRYRPQEAGDTSVVGWQLMALKSGHLGYLQVPPRTITNASKFLDQMQKDGGAQYRYNTASAGGDGTTAVGLLCRMYLGWKRDNPALQRGVQYLASKGPSNSDMYYNYYATQVLRQYDGDAWEKWNQVMREQLVKSQAQQGHETGSWWIDGDHAKQGGRLYCTSMATMILEVYYRHMPLYGQQASDEEFPL